jgi:Leucine-rich repeat (LRR) protein
MFGLAKMRDYAQLERTFVSVKKRGLALTEAQRQELRMFPLLCLKHRLELDYFKTLRSFPDANTRFVSSLNPSGNVEALPEALGELTQLESLNIANLGIQNLEVIAKLVHLKELNVSHNQLEQLPSSILQLRALEVLNLEGNRLSNLPDEFAQLTQLKALNLSKNLLATLPPVLSKLPQLAELSIGGNHIHQLPASIAALSALRILHWYHRPTLPLPRIDDKLSILPVFDPYQGQPLKQIDDALAKLPNLEYLDLSHHGLAQLPANLHQLKQLKVLALAGNGYTTFPDFIGKLHHLQFLQLSANPMEQVPSKIWKKIAKLEFLGLANTGIHALPTGIGDLQLLSRLDLAMNQFTTLPEFLYRMGKRMSFGEYLRHKMGWLPKYGLQRDWGKEQARFMSPELNWVLNASMGSESYRLNSVVLRGNSLEKDKVTQQKQKASAFYLFFEW